MAPPLPPPVTTWGTRPGYTDAQIKARFGSNARLVRLANGKWGVIAPGTGWIGTPGATTGAPAPGTAGAAPAPAAAPPPAPPPVSYGQEARMQGYNDQIASLPGVYDPQRMRLYAEGARRLSDEGYFDVSRAEVASNDPNATTYQVMGSGVGQRARGAFNDTQAAANSRGMLFSSATREAHGQQQKAIANAREAILRGLAGQQDQITAEQAQRTASLRGDLATGQGEYADWRSQQMAPIPPDTSGAPASTGGRGTPVASYAFRPNTTTLDRQYGVGGYRLTRAGNGKWVVSRV